MATDVVATFEDSLRRLDETGTRTTSDEFDDALAEVIEEPAVGAPLGIEGISLDGTDIVCHPTADQLQAAKTGVTAAGVGIADYGTVAIQSRPGGDEPISLYPELHVAVLCESDIVPDMPAAIEWLASEFEAGRDTVILESGPSATGDMGAIVRRVHGPLDVHVIIVTDL